MENENPSPAPLWTTYELKPWPPPSVGSVVRVDGVWHEVTESSPRSMSLRKIGRVRLFLFWVGGALR